jgi:phage gp29-like protein
MAIIDIHGNPLRAQTLREPQTARITHLQREFAGHPARNLTPVRLARILESAELGDLRGQSELFMDMEERDAHLFAEISKRKRVLAPLEWRIAPPRNPTAREKADAEYLEELLGDLDNWEELLIDLADGIGHGFAAIELEWENYGRERIPRAFHHRPQTWFKLPQSNRDELRLRSNHNDGEPLEPFGWMVHRPRARSGYIARTGLFRVLAWPYLFKHYATRDLAELLHIYGLPIRLGKYPPGTGDDEKATLLRAVTTLGHSAAGIIPEGMSIDFERAVEGSDAPFLSMMNACDAAISKAVLGGTLTTQTGQGGAGGGAYALGKVHDDVRQDLKAADARQLAGTLSRDLLWNLLVLNRPGNNDVRRAPRLVFDVRDPDEFAEYAEAIPKLVDAGLEVPVSWARSKLNVPAPENGEPVLQRTPASPQGGAAALARRVAALAGRRMPANPPAPIATIDQVALDALLDALPPERLQAQSEQLLAPLLDALRRGGDEGELLAALRRAYPDMRSDDLVDTVDRVLFALDAWGRLHAAADLAGA